MRVRAPGKLVVTGAYAVLEGAPAVVVAVDRYAIADGSRVAVDPPAEVRAAFDGTPAPAIDVSALQDPSGRKLGLGSSAAAVVAALGVRALGRGERLDDPSVKARIFDAARDAHARVQSGGSGVDVAASVYGGALRYQIVEGRPVVRTVRVPREVLLAAFVSDTSARTSDLRARVDSARRTQPGPMGDLGARMARAAEEAASAVEAADAPRFVGAAALYSTLLARLGELAQAPIVPAGWLELSTRAASEGGAFLPSGAGGGDVAIWLGANAPSDVFRAHASALGLRPLALACDAGGVRAAEGAQPPSAGASEGSVGATRPFLG